MSNGMFIDTYTPEEQLARLDQVHKIADFIRRGVRTNDQVKRVLQALISDDVNVQITPKVIATPTGKIYHVVGNYDSAAEAIAAGNYAIKSGFAQNPDKIPLAVQPVYSFVRPVPLNEKIRNEKLFEWYPSIADPMTLFTLGVKVPELYLEGSIFTAWKHNTQLWYAMVFAHVRKRWVCVNPANPDDLWDAGCRVLVREYMPPAEAVA